MNDDNVVKAPAWIIQKEFEEFPEAQYYVAVGVSDKSFADARSRAFKEIAEHLINNSMIYFSSHCCSYNSVDEDKYYNDLASKLPVEYFETEHKKEMQSEIARSEYYELFNRIYVENTEEEVKSLKYPSWAEKYTIEQKKYSDGFTFYVLITFDIDRALNVPNTQLIDMYKKGRETGGDDFLIAMQYLYSSLQLQQKICFLGNVRIKKKEDENIEHPSEMELFRGLHREFDTKLLNLYKDIEIKFSKDNVKGWRDKFTEKIEIQIFWKKKLIKVPLRFETSTDAQVELIKSNKDNVSYELRVMPLSVALNSFGISRKPLFSNRTNKSGKHYVEFDLKPEGLRFSKLINFALKKKVHFTLPTKENSHFQIIVKPSKIDKNKIKQGFAQNTCNSLEKALKNRYKTENFNISKSLQTQQTQQTQEMTNKYEFQVLVELENINIIESKTEKLLQIELNLKTLYFDDSLDKPAWVRKKQDSFKYSNKVTSMEIADDTNMFDAYCSDLITNPDFQKVLVDLLNNSLK